MRVLILVDEFFASRERSMLARLEIGLADEGVRVIHAVPDSELNRPNMLGVFRSMVPYSRRVLTVTRGLAARRIVRDLAKLDDAEKPEPIDIVHVFGGSVWALADRLAAALGAVCALEVWRSGLVDKAVRMSTHATKRSATGRSGAVFFAPDSAIEGALQRGSVSVRPTYWGVHASDPPRDVALPGRAPSAMFIGSGRRVKQFQAAFEGIASAFQRNGDGLIFVDALAARRAGIWPIAERLGVLDRLSLIEELESRRDLLLQGDFLVQPEPAGEHKSVVLDAMSSGMLVVSAPDRFVSSLIDSRTASLVTDPSPAAWGATIDRLLARPQERHAVAASAHQYIRTQRPASAHIRAVLDAYAWMSAAGSLPFPVKSN